jgi:methylated-DNA-[protein]-cysteine S-methyltransferase
MDMQTFYESPIGTIEITATENGISSLYFREKALETGSPSRMLKKCIKQLDEYFKGKLREFDLELDLQGTPFQLRVWNELLKIPFGETVSYRELSRRIGNVSSIRAVGNANGKNPVSIIVPCHRVIGSDGKLVGYGGGLPRKKWLLDFERSFYQKDIFPYKFE